MQIFYVDDSGNERLTTFSAIAVPAERWNTVLSRWLEWRRALRDAHDVDVQYRLHATDWVAGRGRPSSNPQSEFNRSKAARWGAYVAGLHVLAAAPGLRILTVSHAGSDRQAAYRHLMHRIEELLLADDDHGLIVIDGDSGELRRMHGELDPVSRRIVEDPWKRDARESQWLQAADFVAYAAFQHLVRRPERTFMWQWYEDCLGSRLVRDPNAEGPPRGGPSEIA